MGSVSSIERGGYQAILQNSQEDSSSLKILGAFCYQMVHQKGTKNVQKVQEIAIQCPKTVLVHHQNPNKLEILSQQNVGQSRFPRKKPSLHKTIPNPLPHQAQP